MGGCFLFLVFSLHSKFRTQILYTVSCFPTIAFRYRMFSALQEVGAEGDDLATSFDHPSLPSTISWFSY